MELPVLISPLPDGRGFTAHMATPFDLSVEAATAEEAHRQLAVLVQHRLRQGIELRSLTVPSAAARTLSAGWLPDDELTEEWRELMQQYRAECDASDRGRLEDAPAQPKSAS